jgi:hypothetical protein
MYIFEAPPQVMFEPRFCGRKIYFEDYRILGRSATGPDRRCGKEEFTADHVQLEKKQY